MPTLPKILGCPSCRGAPAPQITRGGHSGKFFLNAGSCEHVWKVVNYQATAATEEEARARWNAWVKNQPGAMPTTP